MFSDTRFFSMSQKLVLCTNGSYDDNLGVEAPEGREYCEDFVYKY